jgi:hypothetical protein
MARTKKTSKRKRARKVLPALGVAGVSLAMTGGASASTAATADTQAQNTSPRHEIFLGEEEISDVSLSTFYVFDKENAGQTQLGEKVARWGCRCGGCRCGGCRRGWSCRCGWRACRGCGGCWVPWCISRGGCHAC